ncbi:MAG: glycosyltransferase, partial [Chlamydiae bacterium]|nr:glycosyltransferase [Chlamydiota bacterium]
RMSDTLLTFCTSNYNHIRFLKPRLEKLLPILPDNIEYIVVDDCSTDNSIEELEKFESYPNFRLIKNDANVGVIRNNQKMIEESKGEYLYFFSADDLLIFKHFFRAIEILEKERPVLLVTDMAHFDDGQEEPLAIRIFKGLPCQEPIAFTSNQVATLFQRCFFYVPSYGSFLQKRAVFDCGGYIEKLGIYSDYFLNISVALMHGVYYLPNMHLAIARDNPHSFSLLNQTRGCPDLGKQFRHELNSLGVVVYSRWVISGMLNVIFPRNRKILNSILIRVHELSWIGLRMILLRLQKRKIVHDTITEEEAHSVCQKL